MWIVCKLVADRSAKPSTVIGTWGNGTITESNLYPVKAVPMIKAYGSHKTRDDAVRALITINEPDLAGSSIEHMRRIAKSYYTHGTLKTNKIVNVSIDTTDESNVFHK